MQIDLGLAGKVAIVTGGSAGIGRACATELAREGVRVAITGRNLDRLKQAAEEITRETGSEVLPVQGDMSVDVDIKRCVQTAADHFGPIDILINNAASFASTQSVQLSKEAWEGHFNVKVMGYLRMMRETIPHMLRGGQGGRIVNIAGIAARQSFGGGETAGGTNAAVVNLSKGVAEQFANQHILVNAIHPGATRTERHQMNLRSRSEAQHVSLDEAERATIADIPIGRMIEPQEVAYLAVFLCSNQANATTGTAMAADGGQSRAVSY